MFELCNSVSFALVLLVKLLRKSWAALSNPSDWLVFMYNPKASTYSPQSPE